MNRSQRTEASRALFVCIFLVALCAVEQSAFAATYEVGPGRALANLGDVPWESLAPGDTVLVYYRSTPYKEKFVLARAGTASAPITVRGVTDPSGQRPIIDGNGATTRANLDYPGGARGVIKIGASNVPFADGASVMPRYLTIENLEIKGARSTYTFTDPRGAVQSYTAPASSIFVEFGEHITIRNCELVDSGNGLFVYSSDALASRDILVESSYLHDNGNPSSPYEHNAYIEGIGVTFQFNRFGALRAGAGGNALKDRSAGLVVRYNWIEGGNRQLDLVNGEDSALVRNDAGYHTTYVYGNVLLEHAGDGNNEIVHYGGDTGSTTTWRKGTLQFYNNTVVSERTDTTRLFHLTTNEEGCDARNNIAYATAGGSSLRLLDDYGQLSSTRNWLNTGYSWFSVRKAHGAVAESGILTGASPGFADAANGDYRLAALSLCIDAGAALSALIPSADAVSWEYLEHQSSVPRSILGSIDVGAFEFTLLSSGATWMAPAAAQEPQR